MRPRSCLAPVLVVAAACVSSPGHLEPTVPEEPLSLSLSALSTPPRGEVSFAANGGRTPYRYTVETNRSGASVGLDDGRYVAGATPNVTDVVQVEDADGHTATRPVDVGPGVAVSPVAALIPPRGGLSFSARGGSGTGFVWSCARCDSGGAVDPSSGVYAAGATGGVNDLVQATDSLGNVGTGRANVGDLAIEPPSATLAPGASRSFFVFVTTESSQDVTWEVVEGAAGGAITSTWPYLAPTMGGCLYVAPATPGTYHLRAVSVVNPAKSREAGIVVAAP